MDVDLEALIKAYDAFIQARGIEAKELLDSYNAKLEEVLLRHPNLSQAALRQAVRFAHQRWTLAQRKPPTIPPQA
jgi:uncharacterized protein (DUF433 family)